MNELEQFFEKHQSEAAFSGIEKLYRKSLKKMEVKTWKQIEGLQEGKPSIDQP